jgi:hypothetical protein
MVGFDRRDILKSLLTGRDGMLETREIVLCPFPFRSTIADFHIMTVMTFHVDEGASQPERWQDACAGDRWDVN